MKIAIQTIVDYDNYGNRLQNYALQQVLEKKGHEVLTLRNDFNNTYYNNIKSKSRLKKILSSVKNGSFFEKVYNKVNQKNKDRMIEKYQNNRFLAFRNFSTKYIVESNELYNDNLKNADELKSFDCFVIGSDQVWNYEFPRFSEFDFLPSVAQPKISYAASFGVDTIPTNLKYLYKKNLDKIDYISVREEKGKEIINDLLPQKDVKVVLDPTLLLDKKEWEKLIKDKETYHNSFILTYFLDKTTTENQKYIKKIAKEKKLEIKNLADVYDEKLWVVDPSEFVNLFSQAEMVFTDSFHACVFSIIFEKYFEIFERNTTLKSMNSRIETLISSLHTGNRWHNDNFNLLEKPDYEIINKHLELQKKESHLFLNCALKSCQEKIGAEN